MAVDPRRRRLLVAGSVAAALGGSALWLRDDATRKPLEPISGEPPAAAARLAAAGMLDIVDAAQPFTISARLIEHTLAPEHQVHMLAYEVEQAGRTYLNPVLRIRKGEVLTAKFWNQLDETSIVHWHGLTVDANNDGNPHYAVRGGAIYDYRIAIRNRAATCWYHPHPHGGTANQVYQGLASFLIVGDPDDDALTRALDLEPGASDIPLLIQDRRLDRSGRFVRAAGATEQFLGHLGAEPMVNYLRRPVFDVTPRLYRLRLLNGSSARIYRVAFVHGDRPVRFEVIGADGGLLDSPIPAGESFLAPGERLDVLVDFRGLAAETEVVLRSLGFDAMQASLGALCRTTPPAAMPAHVQHADARPAIATTTEPPIDALPDGSPIDLMTFRVRAGPRYDRAVPRRLASAPGIDTRGAAERIFTLDHRNMQWRINGVRFDMVKTQLNVALGATEIWEFRNPPDGMPHPMHFHGFAFRALARIGSPPAVRRLALDQRGLAAAETGWKDTVLVWPGERVRVALEFKHDFPGEQVYMLHCHNLEHEDQGMMLNVRIVPPGSKRI